ncbi:MAG: hypothetical protein PVI57_14615, partial [Gemmatimonadota bacterium]
MRHALALAAALAVAVPLPAARGAGVEGAGGGGAAADTILWNVFAPPPVDPLGLDGLRVRRDLPGRPGAPWRSPGPGLPGATPGGPLGPRLFGPGTFPPGRATARLGLKRLVPPWLEAPPVPGTDHPLLGRVTDSWEGRWLETLDEHLRPDAPLRAALRARVEQERRPGAPPAFLSPVDTAAPRGPPGPPAGVPPERRAAMGDTAAAGEIGAFVSEYSDLGMRVQSRAEIGGDWTRFR